MASIRYSKRTQDSALRSKLDIALPAVHSLSLSDAAHSAISGFTTEHGRRALLSLAPVPLSGSMSTGDLNCQISGANGLTLSGKGGYLEAHVSGASKLQLGYPH